MLIFLTGCKDGTTLTGGDRDATEKKEKEAEAPEEEGGEPIVLNIEEATISNPHYRIEQWTGKQMQMVLMAVKPGEEIDLEVHEGHDQFIRIEQGEARVLMGKTEDDLSFDETVTDDWAIFIPAGYYHNVKNTGSEDLKVYTIYAPKEHEKGALQRTYEAARETHEKGR
ncbi:cupin domain-containing protein [Antarcticibacterium flavum]|uniref:Cupin domain-containing protein n=2 Tax=Flavobacteriaceae TaxID=49546 RepID=A0A5B7X7F8_9FLAO|nr:cupin domain-containing protein [Antarcticibacterium sp. W02-3]QCY71426.1 cupin domain-containing protein [Antarcticibacterium flavum]